MCGIAGIISSRDQKTSLNEMLLVQSHRGPDFTGTYSDKGFAEIGHNRLSIIDLSAEANQPFSDETGRYFLSFNGEIYNYKELREELKFSFSFRTTSDTEVLLASFIRWGKDCLKRLKGMFAFAIWDSKEKKLFAARDRFGVKPFYYALQKEELYFGSEIKTLQKVLPLKQPDEKVWASYFAFGSYGLPNETFYKGIKQLPAGHLLEFSENRLNITQWYDFKAGISAIEPAQNFSEAKDHYFRLLKESIALRFRADVPVGFNLSGGVDSSLLLALVNLFEDKKAITAYSFYTGDDRYDEIKWVEKMIATTNNPLKKIKFSAKEVPETAALIAGIQDEPFGGIPSLAYSAIFKRAGKDGVKVLLDGQGMDEQWAGYDYYQNIKSTSTIQGTGNKSPFRKNVLEPGLFKQAEKPEYPEAFDNRLQNLQYRDLFYTKIPRALRFNDRLSMAYSTELREPFLDHHMVEFAFKQPEEYKIYNSLQKYLIREILKELAPHDLSYAPKRALQTPQREWLGEDLRDFTKQHLEMLKTSSVSHWFDHKKIEKEWQDYQNGNNYSSFHLWQWINTSLLIKDN